MLGANAFVVEGEVIAIMSERTARVRLPNGHVLVGHARSGRHAAEAVGDWRPGRVVTVRLSPCDMSKGLILETPADSEPRSGQ